MPQSLQATLKVFRGQHLVKQSAGQGFARVHMCGHVTQDRPFPAKVFHELAGQLDRIPLHATDARHITLIDLREHVVQAVAAFVKKGDDVIMGQQRRLAVDAFSEIAHQVSNRGLQQACVRTQPTSSHIVHPCATTFAASGAWVQVELPYQLPSAFNSVKLDFGMPHRRTVGPNTHLEQGFHNFEQTRHHLGCGEVGLDVLFAEVVACFLELFANEGPVPRLGIGNAQFSSGKVSHLIQVFFCIGSGA